MVSLGVNVIDANRVCANRLHERGVEATLRCIDERVIWDKLVGDSYDGQLYSMLAYVKWAEIGV